MNPHNSPWNKPVYSFGDKMLEWRWSYIAKHLKTRPNVRVCYSYLEVNKICFIAKKSQKMRLKSHIDWCYYDPKTLADAIDNNTIETYYEIMLNDVKSDPNVWKDKDFEMELKSYYAARAGRASLI